MSSKRALRRERERICHRKHRYPDQASADRAARALRRDRPGQWIHSYRCDVNGEHWHIGHPPAAVRRQILARAS